MTPQDQILRKIALLPLNEKEKSYWQKQVPTLSEIDLKQLYQTLFWKDPAQLVEVEAELQAEQAALEKEAKAMPKRMSKARNKAEEA